MAFGPVVAFAILAFDSPDAPGNFATVRPADRNQLRRTDAITALRQCIESRRLPVPLPSEPGPAASLPCTTTRQSAGRLWMRR